MIDAGWTTMPLTIVTVYQRQMQIIRELRDRHLASVSDEQAQWRPRPDLPPIAWHAAHASLFTALTFCGMGRGDWSFATPDEIDTFNFMAPTPGDLPAWPQLRQRIAMWDAASDAVAASVTTEELTVVLPHLRPEWLPDSCRTWGDSLLYMVTHEPLHHGQISVLRRLAGHPRIE